MCIAEKRPLLQQVFGMVFLKMVDQFACGVGFEVGQFHWKILGLNDHVKMILQDDVTINQLETLVVVLEIDDGVQPSQLNYFAFGVRL